MITREPASRTIRVAARWMAWRGLNTRIEGLEHLPRLGGAVIAARHVHHLYDGCLFLSVVPRPVHLLVALDWVADRRVRGLMERACSMAEWPVALRPERLRGPEQRAYLRRAVTDSIAILRAGRILVVFPEAYPNVDPHPTPKADLQAFLPFRPGFVGLADLARKEGAEPIPIVPAGLRYEWGSRWTVTLRLGAPLFVRDRADRTRVAREIESQVRLLSAAPIGQAGGPTPKPQPSAKCWVK